MEWGGGVKEKLYFNLVDKQSFKYIFFPSLNVASIETSLFAHPKEKWMNTQPGKKIVQIFIYHAWILKATRVVKGNVDEKREKFSLFLLHHLIFFFKECMPLLFACIAIANDVFRIVFYFRGLETCSCMKIVLCGMEFPRHILVSMFWLINTI